MPEFTPEKPASIRNMFSGIASRYDAANTMLSFGIHHRWRKQVVRASGAREGSRVLDCATGTGDLAFEFESALKGRAEIVATDFCEEMLEIARQKARARQSRVRIEAADMMALPYPDGYFDYASVGFGIRNTRDPAQALGEMARVVKPGGKVLVLETGQPENPAFRSVFGLYSRWILPRVGGWLTGSSQAYEYLRSSSSSFPWGRSFLRLSERCGRFSETRYRPLQNGIAYLYTLEVGKRVH